MNGTKIRPYFESRQAFLGSIVFGFCLGEGALSEGYKLKHANGLQAQQPTADHDEFEKIIKQNRRPRDLPTFSHGVLVLKSLASHRECGRGEGGSRL